MYKLTAPIFISNPNFWCIQLDLNSEQDSNLIDVEYFINFNLQKPNAFDLINDLHHVRMNSFKFLVVYCFQYVYKIKRWNEKLVYHVVIYIDLIHSVGSWFGCFEYLSLIIPIRFYNHKKNSIRIPGCVAFEKEKKKNIITATRWQKTWEITTDDFHLGIMKMTSYIEQ